MTNKQCTHLLNKNTKEAYTDGLNITKREALPEEDSIHTAEMTAIKVALWEMHKETQ